MKEGIPGKAYRYEVRRNVYDDGYRLILESYEITKETPKGYWINGGYRFVLNEGRKAYCRRCPKAALNDFIKRKEKQIEIVNFILESAKEGLRQAREHK